MNAPALKCLRCGGPAVRLLQTGELSCARQCTEHAVAMGRRMVLEEETAKIARAIGPALPRGVGFVLVLADFGGNGNMAYVSSVEREGAVCMLRELLDKMVADGGAT